jgi:hypothetical protein
MALIKEEFLEMVRVADHETRRKRVKDTGLIIEFMK